jgi:hypothetical protein
LEHETPAKRAWAAKAGAVILEMMELSENVLVDAAAAPDNLHAILRAMASPEMLRQMQASDPLANAFLRGIEARATLIKAHGGVLTTEEVARFLGVTEQAVTKRRHSRQLLGLTFRKRGYVYPVWQFSDKADTGVIPGLQTILMELAEHDEWTQNAFFITPNTRLEEAPPLQYLREGKLDEVLEAAREFGHHGAE